MKWLWDNFKLLLKNLFGSLHNNEGGYSGRKLAALSLMFMIAYCVKYHTDNTNAVYVIAILVVGVLLCLSVVTAENVIKFISSKNGGSKGLEQEN